MRRTRFDDWPCPIARTTDLIGDWWTPLVMREAFAGARRFEEFQHGLDAPRAVLTARLRRLCDEGLLDRVEYQSNPPRHEYRLTEKGRQFWGVLAAMWRWGSDWLWTDGEEPPVVLQDRETGEVISPVVVDEATGVRLDVHRLRVARNPAVVGAPRDGGRAGGSADPVDAVRPADAAPGPATPSAAADAVPDGG